MIETKVIPSFFYDWILCASWTFLLMVRLLSSSGWSDFHHHRINQGCMPKTSKWEVVSWQVWRICLCLEEIVWKVWFVLGHFKDGLHDCNTPCSLSLFCCSVFLDFASKCFFFFFNVKGVLENTEKERTNRLIRLKPPTNIWSETWLKCLLQSQLCSSPGVWASCGFYSSLKLETKKLSWEII